MGKGSRVRAERRDRLALVFCDVDYDRASRPFGAGVAPAPPRAWAVGRAGLVHAVWERGGVRFLRQKMIDGHHVASRLVAALSQSRGLVVGHGLLTCDLPAVSMVTDVPDELLSRCVDTLALAHRLKGGRYSTGCNLSALTRENLGERRAKPHYDHKSPASRGDHDPCDDARLVGLLWQSMLTTRTLATGTALAAGQRSLLPLADGDLAELTGRAPQTEVRYWLQQRERATLQERGPSRTRPKAITLSEVEAHLLPSPGLIGDLAEPLRSAGLIPDGPLSDERLLTACQWLGERQNLDVRNRIARGQALTKDLRYRLAQALWESTHVPFMTTLMTARRQSRTSATAYLRLNQLMREQEQTRRTIAATISAT